MTGVLAVTAALSVTTFWSYIPPSVLLLPVLAWAAFRLQHGGAAIAGAVAALLANIMTTQGRGLFASAGAPPGTQVVLTQIYVAVIVVFALLIAQEAAARVECGAERELERRGGCGWRRCRGWLCVCRMRSRRRTSETHSRIRFSTRPGPAGWSGPDQRQWPDAGMDHRRGYPTAMVEEGSARPDVSS